MEQPRRNNKIRLGRVVQQSGRKTVAVEVERRMMEPKVGKYVARRKKFLVHDPKEECRIGDVVRIQETRPISKRKSWKISEILRRETTAQ